MKNQTLVKVALVSIVLILCTTMTLALKPIPQESGFSGFFSPGVGYMSFKTNILASFLGFDLSDEKTDSLFDIPNDRFIAEALYRFNLA